MKLSACYPVIATVLWASSFVRAVDTPTSGPSSSPATTQASQPTARVSPAASKVIDEVRNAFANLGGFAVDGTMTATFDVAGRSQTYSAKVKTVSAGDGRFRHELEGYGIVVSDGKKVTLYDPRRNTFGTIDDGVTIGKADDLPDALPDVLLDENPLLLLSITTEPQQLLASGALTIDVGTAGDGTPALVIESKNSTRTMTIGAKTKLPTRVRLDLAKRFADRGVADAVATAELVYGPMTAANPADADFAFTPPASATEFAIKSEAPPAELIGGLVTQPPSTQPAGQ